jgi:hypothetical protein
MNKYVYRGGLFDKTASVARACLSHFDKYGVLWQSPDAIQASTISGNDVQDVGNATTKTLTAVENGKTIVISGLGGCNITLPKIQPIPGYGLKLNFKFLPTGDLTGNLVLTPAATDTIKGLRVAKTAGQTFTLAGGTDAAGDFLELVSDGVNSWYATGKGVWT